MTHFGPALNDGGVTFRLWAPAAKKVQLIADRTFPMRRNGDWFETDVGSAKAGTRYQFKIDDDLTIADPASRFQPEDVHGPSEVIDQHYAWKRVDWKGRPWHETVVLEVHVGTFTAQGTFLAAIEKLDRVAATGITAVELMPLSDFSGRWNWGYDGVLPFAPDSAYGRPEDLKALIDAAHERGLMVFLDVVYNHFGPEGNYLGRIAPKFFTDAQTPWGGAINYKVPEVRAFAIENALFWVRDYQFDGLRLDAVHAIVAPGEPHILTELSAAVGDFAKESGRHIHLILENDDNKASFLAPAIDPPHGQYRAQWNDDYHHAWHVFLTGEKSGYYEDYVYPAPLIARAFSDGFIYQGEISLHRDGKARGESSKNLSPLAFISFLQNHDQIGNRPLGERLTQLTDERDLSTALAVMLLAPFPPLLFMGEEWGSKRPFPFFCDFKGELAEAIRKGRKAEFADAYAASENVPDPLSEQTFNSAKLDWDAAGSGEGADRLRFVTDLLQIRRRRIAPLLTTLVSDSTASFENNILHASWSGSNETLKIFANFSEGAFKTDIPNSDRIIWGQETAGGLEPGCVLAAIGPA